MAGKPQRERKNKQASNDSAPYSKGGNDNKAKGRGGQRNGGRRGGGGKGKGREKKPKTAEDLDAEMDSYWGKSSEHAQKKLDGDMDDYWKKKGESTADESTKEDNKDAETTDADKETEAAAASE
ncbi:unnamed protein product [Aphanomyces euteiches]